MKNAKSTESYALTLANINKVHCQNDYSCLRVRGYATYAKYTTHIYDNTSGLLLQTVNFDHTYTYKSHKGTGLDYYLVARSISECNAIRNSGYVITASEKSAMIGWRNVSNPDSADLLPWK